MTAKRKAPFRKILVANRGEIAVRVIRACKEMNVATVAVYSEADATARHVRLADEAVAIGPPEPRESYLDTAKIIAACRQTGAEAVHPGYGFLAENAAFAAACVEAGLVFIGPSAEVIERMGEKTAARAAMEAAGVPVVPGALLPAPGPDGELDAAAVQAAAAQVGFPIMVKAAFGGGGKGMRLVEDPQSIVAAAAGASREALGAFGNGTVYLERYLQRPRHVEFQIFGDAHGHAVHVFERECSIQRRHQKIIEETPSPAVTPELRERMGAAAVAAAAAVKYQGAGTVEFLLAADGSFYFLEMNTRLQVEHPITEMVTGLDLVRAQLEVAAGAPLPWRQEEIRSQGHAMECRVYAEDPAQNFMPSLGRLLLLHEPQGPGVRVDSGVREGDEVSMHYDPMIAKLVLHAATRDDCIDRAVAALKDYAVLGVTTNVEYLITVLEHAAFRAGQTHTGFIPDHLEGWQPQGATDEETAASADDSDLTATLVAVGVAEQSRSGSSDGNGGEFGGVTEPSPWERLGRFRLGGMS